MTQLLEDNSHAGQGSVLLDIGGDIGALVLTMPAELVGSEIEIRPVGSGHSDGPVPPRPHSHSHSHSHSHGDGNEHVRSHGHDHPGGRLVHVGVVPRPLNGAPVPSAVFGELRAGRYELYVRPDGPVRLAVEIRGGEVTEEVWPD